MQRNRENQEALQNCSAQAGSSCGLSAQHALLPLPEMQLSCPINAGLLTHPVAPARTTAPVVPRSHHHHPVYYAAGTAGYRCQHAPAARGMKITSMCHLPIVPSDDQVFGAKAKGEQRALHLTALDHNGAQRCVCRIGAVRRLAGDNPTPDNKAICIALNM